MTAHSVYLDTPDEQAHVDAAAEALSIDGRCSFNRRVQELAHYGRFLKALLTPESYATLRRMGKARIQAIFPEGSRGC